MKNTNLIIGKKSIGKTCSVMFKEVKNMIEKEENLFILDNKEEYYKTFKEDLDKKGYTTYIINYSNPLKSNSFNPLMLPYKLYKEGKKDDAIVLIKNIALEIFKNDSAMDPFWQDSAADYFSGIVLFLFENAKEEEINLGSVGMVFLQTESSKENIEKFRAYLNTVDITSPMYMLLNATVFAPNDTRYGIIAVLKEELNKYIVRENLLNLLSKNELDLDNINDKTAIFVVSNSDTCRLANIVTDGIYNIIKNKKIEFNMILDNFDTFPKILCLEDMLETSTIYNTKVYVITRMEEIKGRYYGKDFREKFEKIKEVEEGEENIKVGDYDEYPSLENSKNSYFNVLNFIK